MDRKPDNGSLRKGAPSLHWLLESWRGASNRNFRFQPRFLTDFAAFAREKATMRTSLAFITIASEIYSDAALTSGKASRTAAPDPATAAIAAGQVTHADSGRSPGIVRR
jgi:hypothetical protein